MSSASSDVSTKRMTVVKRWILSELAPEIPIAVLEPRACCNEARSGNRREEDSDCLAGLLGRKTADRLQPVLCAGWAGYSGFDTSRAKHLQQSEGGPTKQRERHQVAY